MEAVPWLDLSGTELRARLVNRGVEPEMAYLWDTHRELFAEQIEDTLAGR